MKLVRKYAMSHAELAKRADRVKSLVERDKVPLSDYGYPADLAEIIQTKTDEFKAMLPDMYWAGLFSLASQKKDDVRAELEADLKEIRFKVKLALGIKCRYYGLFHFKGLFRQKDQELLAYSKHICETVEEHMASLLQNRLSTDLVKHTRGLSVRFEEAMDKQQKAKAVREQQRLVRHDMSNALYDLISEVCNVGKHIWLNKNKAFFHDYVMYSCSKPTRHPHVEHKS